MFCGGLHQRCGAPLQAPATRICLPAQFAQLSLKASRSQVRQRVSVQHPVVAKAAKAALDDGPEASASLKFTKGSAHKLRRVLDQIRGRSYEEALMILEFLPYRACEDILPTLISAAANAKENLKMSKLNLYISECYADSGPAFKRFSHGYKGRAYKILRPTSHLTIKVKERQRGGGKAAQAAAAPQPVAAE
ncbi:50S ribosomal protein L22 [Coccomyxa sp. Obi]|nr:50S ribosomal protein L22 [Coccomyxa sp. Obi]